MYVFVMERVYAPWGKVTGKVNLKTLYAYFHCHYSTMEPWMALTRVKTYFTL